MIKTKAVTDPSLRILDFAVDPIGGQTDEACREIGKKRFKPQFIA
jgi:hypothetical protein